MSRFTLIYDKASKRTERAIKNNNNLDLISLHRREKKRTQRASVRHKYVTYK